MNSQSIHARTSDQLLHACNLQVVDLELSRSSALLQLEDALRALLLPERLGDEWALAQPGNLYLFIEVDTALPGY